MLVWVHSVDWALVPLFLVATDPMVRPRHGLALGAMKVSVTVTVPKLHMTSTFRLPASLFGACQNSVIVIRQIAAVSACRSFKNFFLLHPSNILVYLRIAARVAGW